MKKINETEFELRQKRILEISDRILDKVTKALSEVDRSVIKTKEKEKIVEYDGDLKKPVCEKNTETEPQKDPEEENQQKDGVN